MNPIVLQIDLDLDSFLVAYCGTDPETGYDLTEPQTLESIVIDQAAKTVAATIDRDVRSDIAKEARSLVETAQREVVNELVTAKVTEAIDTPFRRSTSYGEPQGEPTTFRTIIAESVEKALTETVHNPNGRSSSYDSPRKTLIAWAVDEAVKAQVTKQVTAAVVDAKTDLLAAVKAEAANVLTDALAKAIR